MEVDREVKVEHVCTSLVEITSEHAVTTEKFPVVGFPGHELAKSRDDHAVTTSIPPVDFPNEFDVFSEDPECLVCGGEGIINGCDHLDWDEDGYDDLITCTSCQGSGLAKDMTWC